tara:strand:- start:417 stop:725 length:309 start_codon:yes stop_codon:yes gene_type:complete
MKITKTQLKQIIKEEMESTLEASDLDPNDDHAKIFKNNLFKLIKSYMKDHPGTSVEIGLMLQDAAVAAEVEMGPEAEREFDAQVQSGNFEDPRNRTGRERNR